MADEVLGVTVSPNPDVVFRRLGDRMVLVHLKTNEIFELNETSARFWELIVEDGDIASIRARMGQEFDVDPARLEGEVASTLFVLSEERLITGYDAA